MDSVTVALEGLSVSDADLAARSLKDVIALLEGQDADREAICKQLVDGGAIDKLKQLLDNQPGDRAMVAKVIAEVAKTEWVRESCAGLLGPLLALLESPSLPAVTQACRALGNVCFDNDAGRSVVAEMDGVAKLLALLRRLLALQEDGASRARMVACGFLLNLCNTHDMSVGSVAPQQCLGSPTTVSGGESGAPRLISLQLQLCPTSCHASVQEKVVLGGGLELLRDLLQQCADDDAVCQFALLCVGCLADSDVGRQRLESCELAVTVAQLLHGDSDLHDSILELLASLAEQDCVKLQLAESELPRQLLDLLEAGDATAPEDDQTLVKLASDLLVLLLTGDGSMEVLYSGGEGAVYKASLAWLASPSPQLQMAGALAIGNFARNDRQCEQLVQSGVAEPLSRLLSHHDNPTLLHAALSALRNLAIPDANKARMLSGGLLEAVLAHLATPHSPVQFKLLGTLRMLVHRQEAASRELGSNPEVMSRLAEWCTVQEHAGVQGEASRLVAALIRNARASDVITCAVTHGALPHLVAMAASEHEVMQNEALVALTLTEATSAGSLTTAQLQEELIPTSKVILTDAESSAALLGNTLTLLCTLTKSDGRLGLLRLAGLDADLKALKAHADDRVQGQAAALAAKLTAKG